MAPKKVMKTMKKKKDLGKSPQKKGLEKPSNQRGLEKSSGRKGLEKPMKKPGCNDGGVWKNPGTIKDKVKAAAEEAEGDADQGAVILHDLMAVATLGNLKLQTISIGSAGKPLEKVLSLWDRLTGLGKDCLLVLLRVALEKALDCRLHRHGIAKR